MFDVTAHGVRIVFVLSITACAHQAQGPLPKLTYPDAATEDQVDDYHGVAISDPYRWLENPDSPQTRTWIDAQNKLTQEFIASTGVRDDIAGRLEKVWDYERYDVPMAVAGHYFFRKNDGLQNQSVLYVVDSLSTEAEPRTLIDPNILSKDGTVALTNWEPSHNGKLIAYGLSRGGSDWVEWRVRDVTTRKDLPDSIQWTKFSHVSWTIDDSGFYYSRYDEPTTGAQLEETNYFNKLYYHRLGASQSDDLLVYEKPDQKEWGFSPQVTDDGRYLIVRVWKGTAEQFVILYKDLTQPDSPLVTLIPEFEADYTFLDNDGSVFWFRTDFGAPRGRVIAIDVTKPERDAWAEVIAESEDTLEVVSVVGNRFFARYLHDASSAVKVFTLDGKHERDITLPALGTAWGFTGKRADTTTFYAFDSFLAPVTVYRYDVDGAQSAAQWTPKVRFVPAEFETKQVFYTSKDGTRVPMFLSHKRGLVPSASTPTYLYGYGGFNISITPSFNPASLVWMELGGVFAVANLRGGGEYGQSWHQGGMRYKKQNVFDDMIGAAEWLIANGFTSKEKLAIGGRSNGGLLVGACITQRPDLFAAALPSVGVMDMLRFHKFTIGWAWVDDYGSPDSPEDFKVLSAYSPLQNLKAGTQYPATLITTADHDDRVVPAHSFKFAAALQAAQSPDSTAPVLIRVETSAGHGAATPTSKMIAEVADKWAFLARVLGFTVDL